MVDTSSTRMNTGTRVTKFVGYWINLIGLLFVIIGLIFPKEMWWQLLSFIGFIKYIFLFTGFEPVLTSFLFCILGFLFFLVSHFLFKRKKWAWRVSFLLAIIFSINNLYVGLFFSWIGLVMWRGNIIFVIIALAIVVISFKILIAFFKERKNFLKETKQNRL